VTGGLQNASGHLSNASVRRFVAPGKPLLATLEPAEGVDKRSAATGKRPDASFELPPGMCELLVATGTSPTAFGKWTSAFATSLVVSRRL
jgi:hypothetical protein